MFGKNKGFLILRYGVFLVEEFLVVSYFEFIWYFGRFYCRLFFYFIIFKIIEMKIV